MKTAAVKMTDALYHGLPQASRRERYRKQS